MSIYFKNRSPGDPLYNNEDYRNQQKQFISVLRSRTNSFSLKVGELELLDTDGSVLQPVYLNIDLRNVRKVTVSLPNSSFRGCLHELFELWSENPDAPVHMLPNEMEVQNLTEILGRCHDILTVKFEDEWKRSSDELPSAS